MNITIFGATGRVGGRLLEYLREEGHSLTAFVRDPSRLSMKESSSLRIVTGDVLSPPDVGRAVAGAEAVMSALASAGVRAPGKALSEGLRNITLAMREHGARRILAVAAAGLLDAPGGGLRCHQPTYPEIFRLVTAEHEKGWQALRESGLDWTLVCPPNMPSGERTGRYRLEADRFPEGGRDITAEDVADFMIRELKADDFVGRRVGIAY